MIPLFGQSSEISGKTVKVLLLLILESGMRKGGIKVLLKSELVVMNLLLPSMYFIFDVTFFCFRPAVAISMAFFLFQLLLAKYVFLVDRDTTLALDNRYAKLSGTI